MDDPELLELLQLTNLANIEIGREEKRPMCKNCSRPLGVCWCSSITGSDKLKTESRIILLQHPSEEKRSLRTAPILEALLPTKQYIELKGKKFNPARYPILQELLDADNSLLLYPGPNAVSLDDIEPVDNKNRIGYDIIIIDGTWPQAKTIYNRNSFLWNLKQVRVVNSKPSQYVIRTQPTQNALSTVETAAITLSTLENNWTIYETLIQPLKMLCQHQMNHGAVEHQSKEYLIVNGLYEKPMGKKTYKKLKKWSEDTDTDPPIAKG